MPRHRIDIQHACQSKNPIKDALVKHWALTTLEPIKEATELTIRLVEPTEIALLNHRYRHQNKATNVLAFPADLPLHIPLAARLLGDVIICPAVLLEESTHLSHSLEAHWAHIVVHGILHLLGYDHITSTEACIMEQLEIDTLAQLGYENPYTEDYHLE